MPVTRNRVQELLKERASAIQQATFIGQGNADSPVEIDLTALAPQDDPNHGGQMSLAWDDRVGDDVFYATVESDIKEHGYFKGDRQYGDGGGSVTDNDKVFDEMFGPDQKVIFNPEKNIVDVMPTLISNHITRDMKSLWEIPENLVDPRPEFEKDTRYWVQFLRFLYTFDGSNPDGLFSLLYGLRCLGAVGLELNPKGGVKVFSRDEREWGKARQEIMSNKAWATNLNTILGQITI